MFAWVSLCGHVHMSTVRGIRVPGGTDSCEPLQLGAQSWTWGLWKSEKGLWPTSHLSSPAGGMLLNHGLLIYEMGQSEVSKWLNKEKASTITPDSSNLSLSSSALFPGYWGEGLDEDIPFRTEYSKVSHFLYIVHSLVLVLVPMYYKETFLWWWLNKILTYGSNKKLLGVISFLFSFSREIVAL